jgi:hypothetical protein
MKLAQTNFGKPAFSAGGAHDSSPRRQPWVTASSRPSSGRSDRTGRDKNLFLPPLRGLRRLNVKPTAIAVGYYRSPLRGCELAARNETAFARRENLTGKEIIFSD